MSTQTVKCNEVKVVIFDKTVFGRLFTKARVVWTGEKSGRIMKRNAKGHFCGTQNFSYAGK